MGDLGSFVLHSTIVGKLCIGLQYQ